MICPRCTSSNLQRGDKNLWCKDCGFFPIPFSQEKKEMNSNQSDPSFCQVEQPDLQPVGRVVITPVQTTKCLTARTLAAAFWLSYFTLHWLLILDIVEFTSARAFTTIFFLSIAILLSISIAAREDTNDK